MLLMGVVGLVLALVCSNLAILLLLRGAKQRREVSIRMAMGAGRIRIVRQFLTESLVLSVAGGVGRVPGGRLAAGCAFGDGPPACNRPSRERPCQRLRRLPILVFATVLSIATGVAFGLMPAIRAIKTDAATVMGAASASRHHVAIRYAMVSLQVALSIVLLTATGLFVRSTLQMAQVDLGFDSARLALIATSAAQAGYQPADSRGAYTRIWKRALRQFLASILWFALADPRSGADPPARW